jgi:hypothetical protein
MFDDINQEDNPNRITTKWEKFTYTGREIASSPNSSDTPTYGLPTRQIITSKNY